VLKKVGAFKPKDKMSGLTTSGVVGYDLALADKKEGEQVANNVDHVDGKDAHDEQAEVKRDYTQKQKQIDEAITALIVAIDKKVRLEFELVSQNKLVRAKLKACTLEENREMYKMVLSMKTAFTNAILKCQQLESDLKALCACL